MVLIREFDSKLLIASCNSIIQCDVVSKTDRICEIPEPILPDNLPQSQLEILKKEVRTICSVESSPDGRYLAVATENKQVVIFDTSFRVVKNFIVNRLASKVCFLPSNDILVADRTGDVYLYKFDSEKCDSILLLGHLSVITDIVVSECGKFVITCDRDEKIRVSRFPNAYNIVSFCLGHREFVIRLKIVKNVLISASGDGTIRFWDYGNGTQLGMKNTNDNIEKTLIERFAKGMDLEKVEISAVPITDMQIYVCDCLYIAVSLSACDGILLYKTELNSLRTEFVKKIPTKSDNFSFYFDTNLYVFDDGFSVYKISNDEVLEGDLEFHFVGKVYEKYKKELSFSKDNDISALYKRKFDNVQEYLERKKQRLDTK